MSEYITLDLDKYCFLNLLILLFYLPIYMCVMGHYVKFFFFSIVWVLSYLSHVQLCETLWTVAHQAPLSIGFSRQEYWSGLPYPPPRDLPNPRIEPRSPALQVDSLPSEPPGKPWKKMGHMSKWVVHEQKILGNIFVSVTWAKVLNARSRNVCN